jgi:CBS domain-containing protein
VTIASMLKHKGSEIVSAAPAASVAEVARLLSARRIGAVLVLGPARELLGILSERDIVHALAAHGAAALDKTAADIMTRQVRTATPAYTTGEAMELMTEGRFRHLPVLDGGRLVGVVSIGDVVKARLSEQEHEVDSLKAYVAGAA